jgi:acyl-coenzyme A thioesterase PaaI-like protein
VDPQWRGETISAEEFQRLQDRYGPLAQSVRELIDATVRTEADEDTVAAAAAAVRAVTASLQPLNEDGWLPLRHADTGRPLLFTNPAAGWRNPVAPPMTIHHEPDGRCWSEFTLGAAYEGPPGMVHGGIAALLLDQLLGEAATSGLTKPKFTGTISLRYLRGTPLGALHAHAYVERTEGHKTYARGVISDAQGPTVEAEGLFVMPAWARERSDVETATT